MAHQEHDVVQMKRSIYGIKEKARGTVVAVLARGKAVLVEFDQPSPRTITLHPDQVEPAEEFSAERASLV